MWCCVCLWQLLQSSTSFILLLPYELLKPVLKGLDPLGTSQLEHKSDSRTCCKRPLHTQRSKGWSSLCRPLRFKRMELGPWIWKKGGTCLLTPTRLKPLRLSSPSRLWQFWYCPWKDGKLWLLRIFLATKLPFWVLLMRHDRSLQLVCLGFSSDRAFPAQHWRCLRSCLVLG